MSIKDLAQKAISKHKTNDPFEIAAIEDIIVVKQPMHEDVLGFYQYFQKNKIIHLNTNFDEWQQKKTCCHELGHAFIHSKVNVMFLEKTFCIKNKFEIEADKFAAELLIDAEMIDTAMRKGVFFAAKQFGVPVEYFQHKLGIKFF